MPRDDSAVAESLVVHAEALCEREDHLWNIISKLSIPLDLPGVPTQQSIRYAWQNRFDSTDKSIIRKAALRVRFAHEFH